MKQFFLMLIILTQFVSGEEFTYNNKIFPSYISKDFLEKLPPIFVNVLSESYQMEEKKEVFEKLYKEMNFFKLLKNPTIFDPFMKQAKLEKNEAYAIKAYKEANDKNFTLTTQTVDSALNKKNLLVQFSLLYENFSTKKIVAKNLSMHLNYPTEQKNELSFYDGNLFFTVRLRGIDLAKKIISADFVTILNEKNGDKKINATGHLPICSAKFSEVLIIPSALLDKNNGENNMIECMYLVKVSEF